jgi:tetratricopeptide (TPR) repeat protein
MLRILGAAAVLAAAALGAAGTAHAAVTVQGSGLAEQCSTAAKAGSDTPVDEAVCTQSIQEELMPARDRAGTYVNRGCIRLRAKRYDEAIADFDTAIQYQADLAEAYVNRGAAEIGKHRFKESVADLDKAIALGVQEPEKAYYDRAVAHEWLEDYKAAYLDYQKALEIAPDWNLVNQQLARFTVSHAAIATPAAPAAH